MSDESRNVLVVTLEHTTQPVKVCVCASMRVCVRVCACVCVHVFESLCSCLVQCIVGGSEGIW